MPLKSHFISVCQSLDLYTSSRTGRLFISDSSHDLSHAIRSICAVWWICTKHLAAVGSGSYANPYVLFHFVRVMKWLCKSTTCFCEHEHIRLDSYLFPSHNTLILTVFSSLSKRISTARCWWSVWFSLQGFLLCSKGERLIHGWVGKLIWKGGKCEPRWPGRRVHRVGAREETLQ